MENLAPDYEDHPAAPQLLCSVDPGPHRPYVPGLGTLYPYPELTVREGEISRVIVTTNHPEGLLRVEADPLCRACHTDTCFVGIATQIESTAEAHECGLKRFEPREYDRAVAGLVNLFGALGVGVREITARLGFARTQDLVGRSDLLVQLSHHQQLDLTDMLMPATQFRVHPPLAQTLSLGQRPLRRPRNHLTTLISDLVMETAVTGDEVISFEDDKVSPVDRALGTHLAGALTRYRRQWSWLPGHDGVGGSQESWRPPIHGKNGDGYHVQEANLRFYASSVPGNGLGAYSTQPLNITIEGGAQDGVAKGMQGGKVAILKGYNHDPPPDPLVEAPDLRQMIRRDDQRIRWRIFDPVLEHAPSLPLLP